MTDFWWWIQLVFALTIIAASAICIFIAARRLWRGPNYGP